MTRIQRLFCCLLMGGFLAACASPSATEGKTGAALLVTLRNLRTGESFELASQTHTDRVAYYSGERSDASRKVQSDEVMSAFVEELDRQGFGEHARTGRAPELGTGDVIRWALQIESASNQTHWLVGTGSPPAEWQAFQKCREMFLELYNYTVSYQAVKNADGKGYFDEAHRGAGQKPR